MADYDIRSAFEKIENELIASMIRNMKKHREWEDDEGFQWEQWQALQLKNLEEYKRRNQRIFGKEFKRINKHLGEAILKAREEGNMAQELELLEMVKTGKFKKPRISKKAAKINAEFFKMNDRKMEALIQATVSDMEKAETAILRMANDKYRKVIFDAQVYANSGAGTYEKAIDMATRDFLTAGLNCVEYKNGARHTLKDYADMALRTAVKRAYLTGEGEKRKEWGIATVILNKRGNPCPQCLPWVGKILIDDVWSGGSAKDGDYPLMSTAIAANLYHPRCRDSHSTYFEGINTPPDDKFTKEDIEQIKDEYSLSQKRDVARRNYEKYRRLAENSLVDENHQQYSSRAEHWKKEYEKYYRQEHNRTLDLNQFQKYQGVLRELSPKSLEEFREIKYNNKELWKSLKGKYRTLNRYEVEGNISAKEILELDFAAWSTKQTGFNYENLTGKSKKKAKRLQNGGNAAVVKIKDGKIRFAHSRIDSVSDLGVDIYDGEYDLVFKEGKPQFEVLDLGDGIPRTSDTEAKFFEYLATILEKDSKERIVILSEKHMCKSCKHVMGQFQEMFPEVEIVLVHGKRNYNNSEEGLKTWKYRKKMEKKNE